MSSPAFAEVADKEPSLASMWVWAIGLILASVVLEMLHARLGLIMVVFGAFIAWVTHMELSDPYVGPDVLRDLGENYVRISYVSAAVGFLGPALVVFLSYLKGRRNQPNV
jgi:hypothetical protein